MWGFRILGLRLGDEGSSSAVKGFVSTSPVSRVGHMKHSAEDEQKKSAKPGLCVLRPEQAAAAYRNELLTPGTWPFPKLRP